MTNEDYWDALLVRNPKLNKASDETVTLKIGVLKSIVQQAFDLGEKEGLNLAKNGITFSDFWQNFGSNK